jgi:hypothetical protein
MCSFRRVRSFVAVCVSLYAVIDVGDAADWVTGMHSVSVSGAVVHKCAIGGACSSLSSSLSVSCFLTFCFVWLGCPAVIDTGTSYIIGPPYDIDPGLFISLFPLFSFSFPLLWIAFLCFAVIKKIGPVAADCSNIKSLPTISFNIGGHDLPLSPQEYVIQDGGQCVLAMQGCESAHGKMCRVLILWLDSMLASSPMWIIGDPFLRAYYTGTLHFDDMSVFVHAFFFSSK